MIGDSACEREGAEVSDQGTVAGRGCVSVRHARGARMCIGDERTESERWLRLHAFEMVGRAGDARRAPGDADALGCSAHMSTLPWASSTPPPYCTPPCNAIATITLVREGTELR